MLTLTLDPEQPLVVSVATALWGGRWAEATDPLGHPVSRALVFDWRRAPGREVGTVEVEVLLLGTSPPLDPAWTRTFGRVYPLPPVTVRRACLHGRPRPWWIAACTCCGELAYSRTWDGPQRWADDHARRFHPAGTV